VYSIPEGYDPVAAIALGYIGDPQTLPERLLQRVLAPRSRKPLEKFVSLVAGTKPHHWSEPRLKRKADEHIGMEPTR